MVLKIRSLKYCKIWRDKLAFVVVWAVSSREEGCWIMVKNRSRGWELPGGSIDQDEVPEEAALRELYEETGVLGTAKAIDSKLIQAKLNWKPKHTFDEGLKKTIKWSQK